MKKTKIAILGAGNMATALAYHLALQKHDIRLYCIEPDVLKRINSKHCNDKYMPGIHLPKNIRACADIKSTLAKASIIFIAVPSKYAVEVITQAKPFIAKNAKIACISKGLDADSKQPVVMEIQKLLPVANKKSICMVGGPAIATEMVNGNPTAMIVAGKNPAARKFIASILRGNNVKVAESTDMLGVGLASALKNAYAIALGFCDGLRHPANTKAFIVTLAVTEMSGIMLKAGADPKTAPSLAGLGDLLVTGWSPHGRNRKYGERLVRSQTNDLQKLGLTTVEGIAAAEHGLALAKKLGARTPLLQAIKTGVSAKSNCHKPFINFLENLKLGLI
ncbi:MAG: NAD(P)H-dependent glycerol-3-phosphate dehydrogenase [Patescibacteria group bacterium]